VRLENRQPNAIGKSILALGQGVCFSQERLGVLHSVQLWNGTCCSLTPPKAVQRTALQDAAARPELQSWLLVQLGEADAGGLVGVVF
jgi:hypothetical protein